MSTDADPLTSSLPQLPISEIKIRELLNLVVMGRGQDAREITRLRHIAAMKVM